MEDQESEGEGTALTSTQTNLINVVDAATDIPLSTELIECGFSKRLVCLFVVIAIIVAILLAVFWDDTDYCRRLPEGFPLH